MEQIGLFLLLAGCIIGLGAVTVIDTHGLLGTRSPYWTETTIRAHKVTKPLIWIGTILAIIGGTIFYKNESLAGIPLYHLIAITILVLNGCFLSFVISPELLKRERDGKARDLLPLKLQIKIAISFVISITGWWSSVWLLSKFLTK